MNKYFLLLIFPFIMSCNGIETSEAQESQTTSTAINSEEGSSNDEFIESPNEAITIKGKEGKFIEYKKHVEFQGSFDILNNTESKFTSLRLKAFLGVQFENEPLRFIPTPLNNKSEEEMAESLLAVDPIISSSEIVSVDNPWIPSETRTFQLGIPSRTDISSYYDLKRAYFQRTPEHVFLVISYKAISVDGEFEKLIKYDVLDQWKDYQRELGLR